MLSKDPKLSAERLLIFGAIGLYIYKFVMLKQAGQLSGEPDLAVKIDKKKMFDMAEKQFKINPGYRMTLEGIYDMIMTDKDKEGEL